jgi:hypothetical protein
MTFLIFQGGRRRDDSSPATPERTESPGAWYRTDASSRLWGTKTHPPGGDRRDDDDGEERSREGAPQLPHQPARRRVAA